MNKIKFYEDQLELINKTLSLLRSWFASSRLDKKRSSKYEYLMYRHNIPPHIYQPLNAIKRKLEAKIEYYPALKWIKVTHQQWIKLIRYFWYSFILNNKSLIIKTLQNNTFAETIRILQKI